MIEIAMPQIDRHLKSRNRSLKSYPGKLLFGPAGNRLYVDYLEKRPGFVGRIDFIHKCNMTALFEINCSAKPDWDAAECVWYPSAMVMEYEDEEISFWERKTITQKDMAVTLQTWRNKGNSPVELKLVLGGDGCDTGRMQEKYFYMKTPVSGHGFAVGAVIGWTASDTELKVLMPGETATFLAASCVGNMNTEEPETLAMRLMDMLYRGRTPDGAVELMEQWGREYQSFFDELPSFRCSDRVLERTWYYRWYILRNCLARPEYGYLPGTVMYEGRGHKMGKEALHPKGWEFSRLICLSTPLQLTDLGFWHNTSAIHDIIRSFFKCQGEDGIVESAFVDHLGSPFSNFMVWAVYRQYLLDGDLGFIHEIMPSLVRFVEGNRKAYHSENDELQVEVRHQRTGKEYQPSYWYFSGYPANPKAEGAMTFLKRVDRTIYHYLNVLGCSRLLKCLGDSSWSKYEDLALVIARQVNKKMWDRESGFYYDLHYLTDEPAMVKNIVGVYPYWAGIGMEAKDKGLQYLFSREHFATGSVFATVAADCPAYSPSGGWMGVRRGRNACMWNGPSWPYTNGIALDAVGRESKVKGHCYDGQFCRYLREYAWQHFADRDLESPYLVEQYHAQTGEPLSDEPDYNHSFFLRLIVEHVCGLEAQQDRIVIDPLRLGLSYFELEKVRIRGCLYAIRYRKVQGTWEPGSDTGFRIYRDNSLLHESRELKRVEIPYI